MFNDLLRGLALASLPLAWALDVLTFPQMLVVALVMGCCTVFFDVAYQSYLPDIVEPEHIGEGNAKLQAVQSVAMIAGPGAAGGLIKVIGAPLTIAIDAVSFVWSAFWVRRIEHVDTPPPREDRRPLVVEVREGLSFVLKHPLLWRITATTSLANLFSSISGAMLVLYALRLGIDEAELGIGFGIGAVGGLLGALVVTRATAWVGEGRIIPLSTFIFDAGRVPDAAGRDCHRPDGRGDLLHAAEHLRGGALQRGAGQLPPAPVPAPDARPDERLHPLPGLGRDADRRLHRRRDRRTSSDCGRCSGSRPSARSSRRCRCCSPRCSACASCRKALDQLSD